MIATPHFVYVHLHKSGGTFINECLLRFFPGARQLGYHLPRRLIPQNLATLPVLGFVRNPWSYYVSWYAFQSQMAQPNVLFRCVSENRALDFAATVRNLLELGDDDARLDALLAMLPTTYGNQGLNLPGFALAPIRGSGMGFFSFLFDYMYGAEQSGPEVTGPGSAQGFDRLSPNGASDDPDGAYGGPGGMRDESAPPQHVAASTHPGGSPVAFPPLSIGRVESLRPDLLAYLDRLGIGTDPALRAFIQNAAPRNRSRHGSYRDHYNDELAALVQQRDQTVIESFDYRFDP